jgi:hypothetical protein
LGYPVNGHKKLVVAEQRRRPQRALSAEKANLSPRRLCGRGQIRFMAFNGPIEVVMVRWKRRQRMEGLDCTEGAAPVQYFSAKVRMLFQARSFAKATAVSRALHQAEATTTLLMDTVASQLRSRTGWLWPMKSVECSKL